MDAEHRHVVAHLTAYRGGEPLPTLCACGSVARLSMREDATRFVWERPS